MIRLGVAGWPVGHSLSPAIHNAALAAVGLGEQYRYQLLPIPPALLAETVGALPHSGFRGINVTIPHKAAGLALATDATARARAVGAANTLLFGEDGAILAENSDAVGMLVPLRRLLDLRGVTALVLGAGGSARSAVWGLLDAGAAEVRVWNRTPQRARALADELGARAVDRIAADGEVDVLVNCTAVGLRDGDELDALALSVDQLRRHRAIVDFVYHAGGTPLTRAARAAGVPCVDGLEILVAQATVGFELWTGVAAPLDAMRAAVGLPPAAQRLSSAP